MYQNTTWLWPNTLLMLKDAALCKNPLMFDPWAKILLSLKQTHMLATANYWPDEALLTPLQESWMKQPSSTEVFWGVYCIWGTFPQDQGYLTVFTKTYTTTETDRGERTLSLMNLKFTWQGKCNRWISQNSGTSAGYTGKNDLTKICKESHVNFSPWRTIPSSNAYHKRSTLALGPVDVQHEIWPAKLYTYIYVCTYISVYTYIDTRLETEKSRATQRPESSAGKPRPLLEK